MPARWSARIGARAAIIIGFALYAVAVSLPAFAPVPVLLFIALMACGSTLSFVELGLNVEADKVEKATGSLIMSKSHGFWSLGIMTGSLIGSAFAAAGVAASWSILIVCAATLVIGPLVGRLVPDYGPDTHATAPGEKPHGLRPARLGPARHLLLRLRHHHDRGRHGRLVGAYSCAK